MSNTISSANAKPKINRQADDALDNSIFSGRDLCWKVGKHLILDNLNFDITKNKFIGIIGPNGAGKSSLLRCLFAKNQITAGSLHFNQCDIGRFSRKNLAKEIAVVLQEPPTHFDMTVFEIVSMG
ncbi:MAG: ABC transporter ATP-binding protein, partial [Kangiellaceae bacterium]|nr:ABC transporter ATP-binding protein [Kangiellaceae bacterium]